MLDCVNGGRLSIASFNHSLYARAKNEGSPAPGDLAGFRHWIA
jgi:hypothetical protein